MLVRFDSLTNQMKKIGYEIRSSTCDGDYYARGLLGCDTACSLWFV